MGVGGCCIPKKSIQQWSFSWKYLPEQLSTWRTLGVIRVARGRLVSVRRRPPRLQHRARAEAAVPLIGCGLRR